MNLPEKRIVKFIHKHHVMTVAASVDSQSWCWNAFYVYVEELNCFVFTSDSKTRHIQMVEQNEKVSGSIVLETETIGKIRGLQFSGIMRKPDKETLSTVKKSYLKRFPYAVLMKTSLWIIVPDYMKMTDNRLGFGKKLIWEKK